LDKPPVGQKVISGLVQFVNSQGIPLTDILERCKEQGLQPCWISFVKEGQEIGWTRKTIESRLNESVTDVYGREHWEFVKNKLREIGLLEKGWKGKI